MRCIFNPSTRRAVQHKYVTMTNDHDAFELLATNRRSRLEPVIRARFRERRQSDQEATAYIEDVCWEHLAEAIARVRRAVAPVARDV